MARLGIDKDFLKDFSKLEKSVQQATLRTISRFAERPWNDLRLNKLQRAQDSQVRLIRVDAFWRGVVLAPEKGQDYVLIRVLPHDDAVRYAASHRFSVNRTLGIIEVRDKSVLEKSRPGLETAAARSQDRLLGHVSDADLARLGIDEQTMGIARLLTTYDELELVQQSIPETQYTALLGLALRMTPDEVWEEISQYAADGPIDTDDFDSALDRSKDRVVFPGSDDEVSSILRYPFDAWRVFLHPAQRKIAYAPHYTGPVQVTGGAGTGKTVTALHRAAYLAQRLEEDTDATNTQPGILLTTFTRNLANTLAGQFERLVTDAAVRRHVHIMTVDMLARQIVNEAHGAGQRDIIKDKELYELWAEAAAWAQVPLAPTFLNREWEQVILAQDLRTEQAYLAASRGGQGIALGTNQKRQVWEVVQQVEAELTRQGKISFSQLANEAALYLVDSGKPPLYRHVIVDEAQDLHSARWRLLRAAVAEAPNDMFIVGDTHQRIYDNHVSLAQVGINVRGRSRKLTLSYRTTQEILSTALPALGKGVITGLDGEADTLNGYRSPLHGHPTEIYAAHSQEAEVTALVNRVNGWLQDGIEPHAIGIATRTNHLGQTVRSALGDAGIEVATLDALTATDAVRVGTMHKMKGLEFQAVGVFGVSADVVPSPGALAPREEDTVAHAQDLQRERCLLFVSCTRARDRLYLSYNKTPSPFITG